MSSTGKTVLIFTSIMGLMGVAMYFIYKQATKSTTATSKTNAYLTDLANVFSGITKAFDNPSTDIPASAWAGGSSNSYPSISPYTGYSADAGTNYYDTGIGSLPSSPDDWSSVPEDNSGSSDSSDSIDTSEA